MDASVKIGFIGAGKMALALAKGMIGSRTVLAERIMGTDPDDAARTLFRAETGARATAEAIEVLESADVLFLAVKPDKAEEALASINPHFTNAHLLISIVAGAPLALLEENLPVGARVVRVMPNAPAMVGAAASGFALGTCADEEDRRLAERLLASVGLAVRVPEALLDAVTGLSGSGPAFVCQVIEALSDGGVAAGLPRETATRLAAQTVFGSAKMVLETGLHLGQIKDMTASPGGTTIEGIYELEKGALRAALMNAVRASTAKSRKLGRRRAGQRGLKPKRF